MDIRENKMFDVQHVQSPSEVMTSDIKQQNMTKI